MEDFKVYFLDGVMMLRMYGWIVGYFYFQFFRWGYKGVFQFILIYVFYSCFQDESDNRCYFLENSFGDYIRNDNDFVLN